MESLGRCAGPCLGSIVTTLLGAIEGAGSPPLPLSLEEGRGVDALRLGSFFPQQVALVLVVVWLRLMPAVP